MLIRLFAALLLLCLPAMALASDAGVRCVQAQLNASGQQAGSEDGIIGPRTRRALQAHAETRGLALREGLSLDNSIPWCRRLGIDLPALQAFWPSRLNAVLVTVGPSVDPVLARLIRTRTPGIYDEVADLLGEPLAGTDRVVVGSGVPELRRLVSRAGFAWIGDLDRTLAEHCRPEDAIGGFAVPGLMVICLREGVRLRGGLDYDHLRFVLAHESTHLVQFQLTGVPPPNTPPADRVATEGPIWLLEGLADVVGYRLGFDAVPPTIRETAVLRYEGLELPDLSGLQDRRALQSHQTDIYRAGMIGAALMVEDRGLTEAGRLFARMGDGLPFDAAFAEIYGQSATDFYAGFAGRARPAFRLGLGPGIQYTPPAGDARPKL